VLGGGGREREERRDKRRPGRRQTLALSLLATMHATYMPICVWWSRGTGEADTGTTRG
jgi:hypothetical protein